MFYTLTTNPAIDMVVTCDKLVPNKVSRTRDATYVPTGKGINVSFALDHFGISSTILGFFGGFTGRWLHEEATKVCPVKSVEVEGITRMNVFVTSGDDEYIMPSAGAPVPRDRQLEMLRVIEESHDMSTLIVSGSLAPLMEPTYYDEIALLCQQKAAELILDVSHPHLAELLAHRPLLIKPNDEELGEIFNVDVDSPDQIVRALHDVHERGARNILCTLGSRGAYFLDESHVYHATAAKVRMYSTVCAGDASLAAFLSLWYDDRDAVVPALTKAMATGGNVAMSAGIGDLALVGELEKQIRVSVVD
ncbi:MAG: 1-phosphofructokinase [Atopobiaceae bacterium]|nr:1-phosphofructokinase [Atopobiaceae bacterium]